MNLRPTFWDEVHTWHTLITNNTTFHSITFHIIIQLEAMLQPNIGFTFERAPISISQISQNLNTARRSVS